MKKPADRVGLAEKALGPLAKLDKELKDEGRRYLRGLTIRIHLRPERVAD